MRTLAAILLLLSLAAAVVAQEVPAELHGPAQAPTGPGGADYPHKHVSIVRQGEDSKRFWIFYPQDNKPAAAPVVVFTHGWSATDPFYYRGWIDHLALHGAIVIYPRYHGNFTLPSQFTANALANIHAALDFMTTPKWLGPKPDLDRVAFVGHSAGGAITANLSATAAAEGLPAPKAVMLVQPGRALRPELDKTMEKGFPIADLSKIPEGTLLLVTSGDADKLVGDVLGKRIFREATSVKPEDKNFIIFHSDDHGDPPMRADHISSLAPPADVEHAEYMGVEVNIVNAQDHHGYWKLLDALMDAAFDGTNREFALGDTEQQRDLGQWSDGVAVKPLTVLTAEEVEKEVEEKEKKTE